MTLKHTLAAAVLGSIAASAFAADYHWNFDKGLPFKPYPKDAAERVKVVPDAFAGAGALSITNIAGKTTSVYRFLTLTPGDRVMTLTMQQKMTAEGDAPAKFMITLYFNRAGGKQGSAGRKTLVLDGAKEWKAEKQVVPVPEGAAAVQIVIGVNNGAQTLWLDEIHCSLAAAQADGTAGSSDK